MQVQCGRYKHFKGNEYIVYGLCKTFFGEGFVLYQQDYGSQDFWIRPLYNFFDKVSYNGEDGIERFKFISKLDEEQYITKLVEMLKNNDIGGISNSVTGEKYHIISINKNIFEIIIEWWGR